MYVLRLKSLCFSVQSDVCFRGDMSDINVMDEDDHVDRGRCITTLCESAKWTVRRGPANLSAITVASTTSAYLSARLRDDDYSFTIGPCPGWALSTGLAAKLRAGSRPAVKSRWLQSCFSIYFSSLFTYTRVCAMGICLLGRRVFAYAISARKLVETHLLHIKIGISRIPFYTCVHVWTHLTSGKSFKLGFQHNKNAAQREMQTYLRDARRREDGCSTREQWHVSYTAAEQSALDFSQLRPVVPALHITSHVCILYKSMCSIILHMKGFYSRFWGDVSPIQWDQCARWQLTPGTHHTQLPVKLRLVTFTHFCLCMN